MKSCLNIFILSLTSIFFLSSCHTFEHENIFIATAKINQEQKIINNENKTINTTNKILNKKKTSSKAEMAPINVPKQKEKVKTVALNKKVESPRIKKISLNTIKDWSEKKLIKEMGTSDFIKQEGKLKNFQYHLPSCFVDIFLTKKKNGFFVTYFETRSTELYGSVETNKCIDEISDKLNKKLQ
tara:strand:+ start:62 stop:613 length:552 start_codon:yes stop_codon:yes gene_type:complete